MIKKQLGEKVNRIEEKSNSISLPIFRSIGRRKEEWWNRFDT